MSRGYFAVGVYHPKHDVNIGGLWRHAQLYGAAFIFTIGKRYKKMAADTGKASNHIPLYNFVDFDSFNNFRPYDCLLIGVEQDENSIGLSNFSHPMRAIYLLGAEDHGLPPKIRERCQTIVEIESPREWSMNMSHAGTLVLYNRYIKRGVQK